MIIFKLLLAIIAAQFAKLLGLHPAAGLIVGGFIGHFLDLLAYRKFMMWRYKKFHTQKMKAQAEADFLYCFFTLAGKICLADGNICDQEQEKIQNLLENHFKYKKKDKKLALKYFKDAQHQNVAVQSLSIRLVEVFGGNAQSIKNTILILKDIALIDGPLHSKEYSILFTVASVLGFPPQEIESILTYSSHAQKAQNKQNAESSPHKQEDPLRMQYEILGCTPNDPVDKIKRSYREQVAKYHPDKIISKDLPQDFIDFAGQKFKEIQYAYETVKKSRGF